jgi:hypothetical protein
LEGGTADASDIIWNFYQATSVNLGTQFEGAVIAPLAKVTNGNQIDGVLVAKSWTANGELHDFPYLGTSPLPLPEPSSWALMLWGVGGLGLWFRRTRKTRRALSADAASA